jgi:hypothetical protein
MRQDAEVDGKISFKGCDLRGLSLRRRRRRNKKRKKKKKRRRTTRTIRHPAVMCYVILCFFTNCLWLAAQCDQIRDQSGK